jgi:hypothetical protein
MPVELLEDQSPAQCSESIGEPITGVISSAVGEKGLMKFVPHPDERENHSHDQDQSPPWRSLCKEESRRENSGTSKEESEVQNLIQMWNVEGEAPRRMEFIAVGE